MQTAGALLGAGERRLVILEINVEVSCFGVRVRQAAETEEKKPEMAFPAFISKEGEALTSKELEPLILGCTGDVKLNLIF